MLAYVFWHWPVGAIDRRTYEANLLRFHAALKSQPLDGFVESATYRLPATPWLSSAGYEDWYQVESFAALGALNDAAVSGSRREPHDEAARAAAGGTAGIYRLRGGAIDSALVRCASWFSKPAGMTYDELFSALRGWTSSSGDALWQRQMVLGPTPEFCLRSSRKPDLPERFKPLFVPVDTYQGSGAERSEFHAASRAVD